MNRTIEDNPEITAITITTAYIQEGPPNLLTKSQDNSRPIPICIKRVKMD